MARTSNHWVVIVAYVYLEKQLSQKAFLEAAKEQADRLKLGDSIALSQATLSTRLKMSSCSLTNSEGRLVEEVFKGLGLLPESQTLKQLLDELSGQERIAEWNYDRNRRRDGARQSTVVHWENLAHLFGVWQVLNFTTYTGISETHELPEDNIRLGLRQIGPHPEATPNRSRLKVLEIGMSTKWVGSADVVDSFMHLRMRETSSGEYNGDRCSGIYKVPPSALSQSYKDNLNYRMKGSIQVSVRPHNEALLHVYSGISVMRYLPDLSNKFDNGKNFSEFSTISKEDKRQYCQRGKLSDMQLLAGDLRDLKHLDAFRKFDELLDYFRRSMDSVRPIGNSGFALMLADK